ncbi:transmembrane protein, putative (macronuclear) [Tetrahymena thermophila SB210]|uniref:Transmembrane protein, putative n=1 Tax=Tetrahymena thermophila (strain SB210) TaxID=312017 RepID=I7MF10_TETTS|nr:transmembrane protein, putative [Tetrahymena thermophila SB210]EAR98272.2 transmembrane protein, putative [Tetrahymena thermophila SB210]|eukprot:XP_001018517.2 transmembrane protein, putative [Tetrahymena thermophila SB210]
MTRVDGVFQQSLQIDNNIIEYAVFKDQLIVMSQKDQSIRSWDISTNKLYPLCFFNQLRDNIDKIELVNVSNLVIISIGLYSEIFTISIQSHIIYPTFLPITSSQQFKIVYTAQETVQWFDNLIVRFLSNQIRITEIYSSAQYLISLNEFTQSQFICSSLSNFIQLKKLLNQNLMLAINKNSVQLTIIDQQSCKIQILPDLIIKFDLIYYNNLEYVIILTNSGIVILDQNFKTAQSFSLTKYQVIHMAQSLQIQNNYQIYILAIEQATSKQFVLQLQIQFTNSLASISQILTYNVGINDAKQLAYFPKTQDGNFASRLFILGIDYQSILLDQVDFSISLEKQEYLVQNFRLGLPQINGQIQSVLILEQSQLLIASNNLGNLYIWDFANIFNARLICGTLLPSSQNNQIVQFNTNDEQTIIILTQQNVFIFDTYSCTIVQQWNFNNNQYKGLQVSVQNNLAIILINNQLFIIQQNTNSLQPLDFQIPGIINLISYQQNNILIIQLNSNILINSKVDLTQFTVTQAKQISYPNDTIQLLRIKNYSPPNQTQLNALFEIILFMNSQTMYFLHDDLSQFSKVQGIQLSNAIDLNFVADPLDNGYVIGGLTSKKSTQYLYESYMVFKDTQLVLLAYQVSAMNQLFPPTKYYDQFAQSTIYRMKMGQSFGIIQAIGEFEFDVSRQANTFRNLLVANNILNAKLTLTKDQKYAVLGDNLGTVATKLIQLDYYSSIYQLDQQSINKGNFISKVYQSYILGVFLIIKNSVEIYDINTNLFINSINSQNYPDDTIIQYFVLEQYQKVIICKQFTIFIYDFSSQETIYFDSGSSIISNILLYNDPTNNSAIRIISYGQSVNQLDLNLKILKHLTMDFSVLNCQTTEDSLICKLQNKQLMIFSLSKNQVTYQFKPKYQNDYIFGVDELNQNLIVCSVDVNLYSTKGNFKQKLYTSLLQVTDLKFFGKRMIIVCQTYIQVLDRVTFASLATIIPGGGTGNIFKILYIEPYNHIIATSSLIRFGQAFIYSLDTFNLIQSLKQSYTQNNPLMICDLFFDYNQNYLVLFDFGGNFGIYDYSSGAYQSITFVLIKEFHYNPTYLPVGLNFNPSTNNLLLFSQIQIFQQNFAELLNKQTVHSLKQNNYFVELPQLNPQNDIKILILGSNSQFYLYSDFQFQYFSRIANSIDVVKDMILIKESQLLVLGLTSSFQIYDASIQPYQLSLNIQNQKSFKVVTGYQFRYFLAENLFYTIDKKIVHYNFQQQIELKVISLQNNQWLTCYKYLSSINYLVIGLNDGTVFVYQIASTLYTNFNLKQSQSIYNVVKFIIETQSYIFIATQQTIILQIDKTNINNSVKYDLSQFNNQNKKLTTFFADERVNNSTVQYTNRIYLSYLGEKLIRCIDISTLATNLAIKYLQFPNSSYNKIMLTDNQIIFYCTFQLNIHQRDNLQYIMSIRRQNIMDEIIDFRVFNNGTYYIIVYLLRFEFIKADFTQQTISLLDQITISNLLIAKTIFDSVSQQLRVIGVSQDTLFDQQYSLGYYNDQSILGYSQCSLNIQSISSLQMAQTIGLIKPPSVQQPSQLAISPILNQTYNNFYTIYLESNNLQEINFDITRDGQITIVPYSQNNLAQIEAASQYNSQIQIAPATFVNFNKKDILIKGFEFIFNQQSQQAQLLTFNNISQNIYFQSIQIKNQKLQDISFQFQNMTLVILNNLQIQNVTIQYNPNNINNSFFFFSNCSYVYIMNMVINNSTFVGELNSFVNAFGITNLEINNLQITNSNLDFFFISKKVDNFIINNVNIINCTQTKLISPAQQIYFFYAQRTLNLQINNIIYGNNSNIQFINSQKQLQSSDYTITLNSDTLSLSNANFYDNTNIIGNYQSTEQHLIQIYSTTVVIKSLTFLNNQGNVYVNQANNITFDSCNFTQNQNLNGGGIQLDTIYVSLKIIKSTFFQNRVTGSGGGIYISNQIKDFYIDDHTFITQNNALIGGGIRFFLNINNRYNGQFNNLYHKANINSNNALIYGQDIAQNLQSIRVKSVVYDPSGQNTQLPFLFQDQAELNQQEKQFYSGKLILQNIVSGSSFKISISVMDQIGDILFFDTTLLRDKVYPPDIMQELSSIYLKLDALNSSSQLVINGETYITPDQYNQTELAFNFREFQMTSSPLLSVSFNLDYSINQVDSKPIQIIAIFRQCVVGEIYKYFSPQIISCYQCPEGQFSLIQPSMKQNDSQTNEQDIQVCQKCPDSASFCKGKNIVIKDGYWRSSDSSSNIFYCLNQPSNCVSQIRSDVDQIQGCIKGNIGPLCEECDYFGEVWKGHQYSNSFTQRYDCSECSDTSYQIAFIIIMGIFFTLYFFFSTLMFMSSFMHTQTCYYLRRLNLFPISSNSIRDWSGFYLKILINYLQISSMLIYFKLNVFPSFFGDLGNLFQSPSNKINVTINCSIISIVKTRLQKVQAQQIIQLLTPLIFYFIIKFIFQICERLKKYNINNWHKFTLYNLIFAFFQPSSIQFFAQSLSCRQIGTNNYSQFDLLIDCDELRYNRFTQSFSITMILFWIITPLIILYKIKKSSKTLNNCIIRYKYGFYYSEFKQGYYYWEFVRSNLRISLVLLFTFLSGDNIYLVYIQIIFIMSAYIKLMLIYRPIQSNKLQQFEILSILVIIVNLILTALNHEYQYLFIESITYCIHICFISYIIVVIISYKVSSKLNAFGRLIRWIFKKILPHKFYQKFETKLEIKFSTYKKWKEIREMVPYIIGLKALEKAKEISNTINKTNAPSKSKKSLAQKQISQLACDLSRSFSPNFNQQNQDQAYYSPSHKEQEKNASQDFVIEQQNNDKSNQLQDQNTQKLKESNGNMSMSLSKIEFFSNLENVEKVTESQSQNDQSPYPQNFNKKRRLLPSQYQINAVNISTLDQKDRTKESNQ